MGLRTPASSGKGRPDVLFQTQPEPTLDEVTLSRRVESMPKLPISADGPLGEAFLARGCIDFHDAVRHVRDLPWGRPSAGDAKTVLEEGKGTATDKHVLLASLARELGDRELQLVLGIHRMSADASPAAASVLAEANLQSLPEAMVWLRWYGGDYDFSSMRAGSRAIVVLQQELVTLDKLPAYAEQRHKDFLVRFKLASRRKDLPPLEELWALHNRVLDAIIAEQEEHRRAELALAQDIADAEEQARERALTDAEAAAEAAQQEIRERAAAEAARRQAYEESMARREAEAAEREKAAAKRGDRTGRKKTRRAPGQRTEEVEAVEEAPEEETSVRRTTRAAPKGKLAEEAGEATGPKRKRTRKAPGQRKAEEADEAAADEAPEAEAKADEETPTRKAPKRKRTRKAPGQRAKAPVPEEPEDKDEPPTPEDPGAAVAPGTDEPDAPAKAPPKRKRTRKPPVKVAKPKEAAPVEAQEPEPEAQPAPKAEAKKPAPRARKRTRKPPTKKK